MNSFINYIQIELLYLYPYHGGPHKLILRFIVFAFDVVQYVGQVVTCGLVKILDLNHSMCSYWQKDTDGSLTVHTTNKGIV
ncbi:hypothetical protein Hdeb2414_s0003g00107941 [Helianthus debilis subsp. tardiflorus]